MVVRGLIWSRLVQQWLSDLMVGFSDRVYDGLVWYQM